MFQEITTEILTQLTESSPSNIQYTKTQLKI
jgi:hypothetical protein